MVLFLLFCLMFVWTVGGIAASRYYVSIKLDETATKEELYKTTTVIMVIWPFVLAIAIGFNFIEDSLPEKPEPNDPERNQ